MVGHWSEASCPSTVVCVSAGLPPRPVPSPGLFLPPTAPATSSHGSRPGFCTFRAEP